MDYSGYGFNSWYRTIGTHSGAFHCDEVAAWYMLQSLHRFSDFSIYRTRDKAILDQWGIVVDVGGIYDPENLRFDHHQREFRNTFDENSSIKLSSAGLIYKHFGLELIGQLTGLTGSDLDYVYNRLYSDLIVEIDASDNGISRYDGPVRFNNSTSISCRVAALSEMAGSDPNSQFSHFEKAMDLFGDAFHLILENIQATLQYKSKTYDMIKNRFNYHPSGAILIQEGFLPTYTFIREFEDELGA